MPCANVGSRVPSVVLASRGRASTWLVRHVGCSFEDLVFFEGAAMRTGRGVEIMTRRQAFDHE